MVDAVRKLLTTQNLVPQNFYYEKFSGSGLVVETGEERLKPVDVDEAFETRMALELGAAQLTMGRLSGEQLAKLRRLAEATAPFAAGGRFTDLPAYSDANLAFHMFLIERARAIRSSSRPTKSLPCRNISPKRSPRMSRSLATLSDSTVTSSPRLS